MKVQQSYITGISISLRSVVKRQHYLKVTINITIRHIRKLLLEKAIRFFVNRNRVEEGY